MQYTNLDSRLKAKSLSARFLKRLERIRKAALQAKALAKARPARG